jgi:GxxExxY protein
MSLIKTKSENFIYKELTYKIIGCAMEVHKSLGVGFLESVYEPALRLEFKKSNLPFESQVEFPVIYRNERIKSFICDLVVDKKVIIELKAIKQITDLARAQILNYLKVTNLRIGLLINFGSNSLQYERIIL